MFCNKKDKDNPSASHSKRYSPRKKEGVDEWKKIQIFGFPSGYTPILKMSIGLIRIEIDLKRFVKKDRRLLEVPQLLHDRKISLRWFVLRSVWLGLVVVTKKTA